MAHLLLRCRDEGLRDMESGLGRWTHAIWRNPLKGSCRQ